MLNKSFIFILSFLLVLPLVSGGFFHAMVPHSHSENAVITSDMHSAFVHEENNFVIPAVIFSIVLFSILVTPKRTLTLNALLIKAKHSSAMSLRRGIVPYRRFG